ncbi:hypothetical protein A6A07_29500 [Streptomyces sp. CB03911]|nr:hypothetical protein A6A07_29500 [Streptomyces sp. CB03911]
MVPAAGGAAPGRHGAPLHVTPAAPTTGAALRSEEGHVQPHPQRPHPADDARASALVHDVFHDFADELAAGRDAMKRRMLNLFNSAMASDHAAGALTGRDVARLLLAVQNGLVFDAATPNEVWRAPGPETGVLGSGGAREAHRWSHGRGRPSSAT